MWVGVPGVTSYRAYKYFKGRKPQYSSKPIMSEDQATAYAVLALTTWYGGLTIAFIACILALPKTFAILESNKQSLQERCNRTPWSESDQCQR